MYHHWKSCFHPSIPDLHRFLVDAALDSDGKTALMLAVQGGDRAIVRTIVDNGADIFYTNVHGQTAFTIAQECGFEYMTKYLETEAKKKPKEMCKKRALIENQLFPPKNEYNDYRKERLQEGVDEDEGKDVGVHGDLKADRLRLELQLENEESLISRVRGLSSSLVQAASVHKGESFAFISIGRTIILLQMLRLKNEVWFQLALKYLERYGAPVHVSMLLNMHMFSPVTVKLLLELLLLLSEAEENLDRLLSSTFSSLVSNVS